MDAISSDLALSKIKDATKDGIVSLIHQSSIMKRTGAHASFPGRLEV